MISVAGKLYNREETSEESERKSSDYIFITLLIRTEKPCFCKSLALTYIDILRMGWYFFTDSSRYYPKIIPREQDFLNYILN